jgi:hypothetical protein
MKLPLALAAFSWLLLPSLATAQRCSRGRAGVLLPIQLTVGVSDFGVTPSTCSDLRIALDVRAGAIIDTADFYGALGGEAVISATLPLGQRIWITAGVTPVRFRFAQNATLVATGLSVGASDVALNVGLLARTDLRLSTYLRVLVPTETGMQYAVRTGIEPGLSLAWRPNTRWSLLGGFSLPIEFSFLGGRGTSYGSARTSIDGAVLISTWFEPLLGIEARIGNDPDGAIEYIAPRFSLRFHLGRGVMVHLSGLAPLLGIERTNARISMGVSVGL